MCKYLPWLSIIEKSDTCVIHSLHHLERISASMESTLSQHWRLALESQYSRLPASMYQKFLGHSGYDTLQVWLQSLNENHSRQFPIRQLKRLQPFIAEFELFVRSVTTMVQGGGAIGCLIWGALQAVIDVGFSVTSDGRSLSFFSILLNTDISTF